LQRINRFNATTEIPLAKHRYVNIEQFHISADVAPSCLDVDVYKLVVVQPVVRSVAAEGNSARSVTAEWEEEYVENQAIWTIKSEKFYSQYVQQRRKNLYKFSGIVSVIIPSIKKEKTILNTLYPVSIYSNF